MTAPDLRRQPDSVAELSSRAGLVVRAQLLREPDGDGDFSEKTQQAFLSARKRRGPLTGRRRPTMT